MTPPEAAAQLPYSSGTTPRQSKQEPRSAGCRHPSGYRARCRHPPPPAAGALLTRFSPGVGGTRRSPTRAQSAHRSPGVPLTAHGHRGAGSARPPPAAAAPRSRSAPCLRGGSAGARCSVPGARPPRPREPRSGAAAPLPPYLGARPPAAGAFQAGRATRPGASVLHRPLPAAAGPGRASPAPRSVPTAGGGSAAPAPAGGSGAEGLRAL